MPPGPQLWLGHSDLETTSCYLKAISGKQKGVREKVDATFAGIAVKPMRQSHEATIGLRSCNGVAFVLRFRDSQQSLGYKKRFFTLNCGEQKANMLDSFCGRRTQARAGDCGGILVARHLKTTDDLFDCRSSPRTESLVAAAVQWAERIMRKIDSVHS